MLCIDSSHVRRQTCPAIREAEAELPPHDTSVRGPQERSAMARLPYIDAEHAPDRVREALDAIPPLNIFRMVATAETAFRPWLALGGALLGSLELDPRLRELAILRVARLERAE